MNLLESLSPIVFHSTNVDNILSILKTNEFQLATSMGTTSDEQYQKPGYHWYLSTSKIKHGGYNLGNDPDVKLVLDGSKLNDNYPAKPVDYWGYSEKSSKANLIDRMAEAKKHRGPLSKSEMREKVRFDENEERLFSKKPVITNAKKYIKQIHIRITDRMKKSTIEDIADAAGNIPVYLYVDDSAYETLNTKKATDINSAEYRPETYKSYTPPEISISDDIMGLYEWCTGNRKGDNLKKFMNGIGYSDWGSSLMADIHNYKKDPKVGKLLHSVAKYMHSKGFKKVSEVLNEIKEERKREAMEERKKLQADQDARMKRVESLTELQHEMDQKPKPIYTSGDVNPYDHGGILFYEDATIVIEPSEKNENACLLASVNYDKPSTINWIDQKAVASSIGRESLETNDQEENYELFSSLINYYGIDNFGSDGFKEMAKSEAMKLFPIDGYDANDVFTQLEIETED